MLTVPALTRRAWTADMTCQCALLVVRKQRRPDQAAPAGSYRATFDAGLSTSVAPTAAYQPLLLLLAINA